MIVYEGKCIDFIKDSLNPSGNHIEDIIQQKMNCLHVPFSNSEKNSWSSSLPALAKVLHDYKIIDDAQIGIEYTIKGDKHRIDVIICGCDDQLKENAVIVELKQWSTADYTNKPYYINTVGGGGKKDYWHPSYQAANYAGIMENFYAYVQDSPVIMESCSYLHNMSSGNYEVVGNEILYPKIKTSPVFIKGDEKRLGDFIKRFVKHPCKDLLYRIDHSKIRPSPKLSDMLYDSIHGKEFFSYSEEQADAVSTIVDCARDSDKYGEKRTIIVKGRPGTGKSIVAINVLGQLMHPEQDNIKSLLAVYCTSNTAPRELYMKKLLDQDLSKGPIMDLFKSPNKIIREPDNSIPCALFDEAHRMYDWKGGTGLKKDVHVIKECIRVSKVSVFFIDEDQAVTVHDYLTIDKLRKIADSMGSRVIDGPTLETQFRVIGGNSYLQFIRYLLCYGDEKPVIGFGDYDIRIFDSASEMRQVLREKNDQFGDSRMVAGYTYEWVTKKDYENGYDIILDDGKFKAKWNMSKNDYSWLYDSNSFEDVGCIHTCQGLDMQYCGVIIGKDVRYENDELVIDQTMLANSDRSSGIRTCKDEKLAMKLIRNTYNVLLTRGMRGTFIYCVDKGLRDHIRRELKTITNGNHQS